MDERRGKANATERGMETGANSLQRAIKILEVLQRRSEPMRVSELASELRIPRSSAYLIVRELIGARLLSASLDRRIFLGPKLFELGMDYRDKVDLLREAAPIVRSLRDTTGETIQLSVLDVDALLVLLKEEGTQPVRIVSRVGSRVPVNWGAGGRLIVSDLAESQLRELLRTTMRESPTGKATTDDGAFIRQVQKAREQGYFIEIGETNEHAGCIAAPVLDSAGRCIAALSIAVPEQRLKSPNRKRLIEAVQSAARLLSERIGTQTLTSHQSTRSRTTTRSLARCLGS